MQPAVITMTLVAVCISLLPIGPVAQVAEARHDPRSCSEREFLLGGQWEPRGFRYNINLASLPSPRTSLRIQAGHRTWNDTRNTCHRRNQDNFFTTYDGDTSLRFNPGDGVNVIDFGVDYPVSDCDPTFIACAVNQGSPGGFTVEGDIRFRRGGGAPYRWYSGVGRPAPGDYDVWGVAAHEAGHSIGVDHAENGEPPGRWATMYWQTDPQELRKRNLARSDVAGMRRLYPDLP